MFFSPNPDYSYISEDVMFRCSKIVKIADMRAFQKIIS